MDPSNLLQFLMATPLRLLVVLMGALFLFLSFIDFKTISVAPLQRRRLAIMGTLLVIPGITLYLIPRTGDFIVSDEIIFVVIVTVFVLFSLRMIFSRNAKFREPTPKTHINIETPKESWNFGNGEKTQSDKSPQNSPMPQEIEQAPEFDSQKYSNDLLNAKRKRLQALELQAAHFGSSCPPHILIEIEDLRKEIGS